jgi:hypothetical protein
MKTYRFGRIYQKTFKDIKRLNKNNNISSIKLRKKVLNNAKVFPKISIVYPKTKFNYSKMIIKNTYK